jgi:hypothetical protein
MTHASAGAELIHGQSGRGRDVAKRTRKPLSSRRGTEGSNPSLSGISVHSNQKRHAGDAFRLSCKGSLTPFAVLDDQNRRLEGRG